MDGNSSKDARTQGSARTLGTAIHTLKALDAIARNPRGIPAKVLAHRLDISLSSAYSLINSLRTEGFVEVSPVGSGLFTLGPKVLRLYQGYVEASTQPERFEPLLEELRDRARARAYVGLWKDGDLEVAQIRGRRGARMLHDVTRGFRGAAHALALGKIYLAVLREDQWPTYLRRPILQRFSRNTITSRLALHAHLPVVRRHQIALDVEEYETGSCCVAAPLHDTTGRLVATLGLSVSAQRFRHDRDALVAIARDVSRKAEVELASKQGLSGRLAGGIPGQPAVPLWVPPSTNLDDPHNHHAWHPNGGG
jgi:IclR family transcriptional regulator, acetate operon repressor